MRLRPILHPYAAGEAYSASQTLGWTKEDGVKDGKNGKGGEEKEGERKGWMKKE